MDQGFSGAGFAVPQVFPDGNIDLAVIRDVSVRAEQMGYDSLWVQERIIGTSQSLEPLALLSYLAAVTEKVRLGVSVLVLPLRSPPQLAKTLATIDVLSGGRLTVGIGLGGGDANAEAYGMKPGRRVRRFMEALSVIDALWKDEFAEFEGEIYSLSGTPMAPKPVQKPRPPVWFGARAEPAIRRAAKYGDGWMGPGSSSADDFKESVGVLRSALEAEGKDFTNFPVSKRVYVAIDDDADRAERRLTDWFGHHYGNREMAARVSIWGPADHCYEQIDAIIDAGAEHLLLNPVFDYDEHLDALQRYTRP
ncbi:MAG: TIGR03619 family F420-dependent LLM class oxidoreductase [Chloroflexi bacterium]|nr:TIGR03619 family F420-dependent LLM class oxidoreductase [Chloroflexota bacterium]